jgi:Zn-dependent oligopeptidase
MPKRYQKEYKMIARLLRRFCSPEVEMMLKHLEEHPEDFRSGISLPSGRRNKWEVLAREVASNGTAIEQNVLRDVKRRAFKKADRQRLLGQIVAQTVAPESVTDAELEDGVTYVGTGVGHPAQIASQQHLQLHKLYQQQMALNAAQGIGYGGAQQGLGNIYPTSSKISQP